MNESQSIIRLYYVPQSFPCGPQSSCCGPVGQSEEDLRGYQTQLEARVPGVQVQTIDVTQKLNMSLDLPASKLINSFGWAACPIFTLAGEVISLGPPSVAELIELVKTKLEPQRAN